MPRSVLPVAPSAAPLGGAGGSSPSRRVPDLAGYRLVRLLDDEPDVATWLARGEEETVVLRAFRETASDARIDAEITARERLAGRHAPALLDLATGPTGRPIVVVSAVVGPLLSDALARHGEPLRAGHLTTLLAPLAALVDAAHESGTTLGRLDARAVRLDPSGAPVLVALGHAMTAAPLPERFRSLEPAIIADREQLDALALELCARVEARERESAALATASAEGSPGRLELALFDCAAPLPLGEMRIAAVSPDRPRRDGDGEHRSGRITDVGSPPSSPLALGDRDAREAVPVRTNGRWQAAGERLGLPAGLLAPVDAIMVRAHATLARGTERLRPGTRRRVEEADGAPLSSGQSRVDSAGSEGTVRRRLTRPRRGVVLLGAAGALALVIALAVGAAESESSDGSPPIVTGADSAAAEEASTIVDPSSDAAGGPGADPVAGDDAVAQEDPGPDQWSLLIGELVERWMLCSSAPTEQCAAEVANAGSAAGDQLLGPPEARAAATAVLHSWADGDRGLVVVDRQGGAAVVELLEGETATASLLVMRSEAGWRIRAVLPSAAG